MSFLDRPQTTFGRRALFQVHLWTGIVVAAYALLIGLTGAALMFRGDMQQAAFTRFFTVERPAGTSDAPIGVVVSSLQAAFPLHRILGIDYPTARRGTYLTYLMKGDTLVTAFSNPISGDVIGELPRTSYITTLQNLHFELLAGGRGRVVNGVAAACLLVMCLTGLVIWWPGIGRWRRALSVDWSKPWHRVLWELHGAVGIWLFVLLLLWAVSGVYFAFPGPFRRAVNAVLPLTVTSAPESAPRSGPSLGAGDFTRLVADAHRQVPGAKMGRIAMPSSKKAPIQLVLAYVDHGDFDTSDEVTLYFDQYSGALLERRDQARQVVSAGDAVMRWLGPLHVGSVGGRTVKYLWAVAALAFPLLAVTGTIMWWRRVLL